MTMEKLALVCDKDYNDLIQINSFAKFAYISTTDVLERNNKVIKEQLPIDNVSLLACNCRHILY